MNATDSRKKLMPRGWRRDDWDENPNYRSRNDLKIVLTTNTLSEMTRWEAFSGVRNDSKGRRLGMTGEN
jgi:hypothetical protein